MSQVPFALPIATRIVQAMPDAAPHIDWILRAGRFLDMDALTAQLAERLVADGLPLSRLRFGIRTTHPLTAAISVTWDARGAVLERLDTPIGYQTRPAYIGSPMEIIVTTGAPFRKQLTAPLTDADHSVLHSLKAQGATDYYGMPVPFQEGNGGMFIAVTDAATGFDAAHITTLDRICAVMAVVAEAHSNRHLAQAIATSYLGPRTGQRVLDGQITRGDIETMEAAILFSDIRGWTALNAEHTPQETVHIANRYFECIAEAVDAHEGEILKFMGDGVLAVFPRARTQHGDAAACGQAIAAAGDAHRIAEERALPVAFGIGIHFGAVLYGNVGAQTRIDFTVLGQAVNTAARIEACCGRLAEPVLLSETVANLVDSLTRFVSAEPLKGLEHPLALHAPASS